MALAVVVPAMGESISEAIVARWEVAQGQRVERDAALVELETDKITVVVSAPAAGVVTTLLKAPNERVRVGETLAWLQPDQDESPSTTDDAPPLPSSQATSAAPLASAGPAARRLLEERGLEPSEVQGSGPRNTITKADVLAHATPSRATPPATAPATAPAPASSVTAPPAPSQEQAETLVPMSPMRKRIAQRLLQAQQSAAILTTFNELDLSAVSALRSQFQADFTKKYGIKLGFMSFFVKASIEALREFPLLNAEIRGEDLVYKNHLHIGVAVGGGKGLVVPVIRHADRLSFAQTELELARLAEKARQDKLSLDDLSGGTFTISNGGVYGSMMSTPILNPPQSGILGLHRITERPVAIDGKVEIRPMMYLALSYDHRIVDGREAVQFLVRIKECVESPGRLLLQV